MPNLPRRPNTAHDVVQYALARFAPDAPAPLRKLLDADGSTRCYGSYFREDVEQALRMIEPEATRAGLLPWLCSERDDLGRVYWSVRVWADPALFIAANIEGMVALA